MAKKDKIFNNRKRKLYRSRISFGEAGFGASFIVLVALMALWFAARKDDFDPTERDISMEIMEASIVVDTLYRRPLVRWADPAMAVAGAPVVHLGVFPQSILDGGWTPSARLREFDASNLYEKINGAAPQFFAFGFERLHFLSIEDPQGDLELSIEFYDMGAFQNALGIYAAQRDDAKSIARAGKAYYYETEAGALGVAGRHFFKIFGNQNSQAVRAKAVRLVGAFGEMEAVSDAVPPIYRILSDILDIPFKDIVYQKKDAFQYDFAKGFWFGKLDREADIRCYIHKAESAEAASGLFDKLYENHLYDYDEVERGATDIVLKHKFLKTYLTLNRAGNLVFGVDGAHETAGMERSLGVLREALFHNDDEG